MTQREKLQLCYELAFYPPRLNELWSYMRQGGKLSDNIGELLDTALMLHMALPEKDVASQRALERFALYQARARAFGMVGFIKNLRKKLGRTPLPNTETPEHMIRDLALPPLARNGFRRRKWL